MTSTVKGGWIDHSGEVDKQLSILEVECLLFLLAVAISIITLMI